MALEGESDGDKEGAPAWTVEVGDGESAVSTSLWRGFTISIPSPHEDGQVQAPCPERMVGVSGPAVSRPRGAHHTSGISADYGNDNGSRAASEQCLCPHSLETNVSSTGSGNEHASLLAIFDRIKLKSCAHARARGVYRPAWPPPVIRFELGLI